MSGSIEFVRGSLISRFGRRAAVRALPRDGFAPALRFGLCSAIVAVLHKAKPHAA
jgi:hypothetical protein